MNDKDSKSLSPEQARREFFPTVGRGTFYTYLKTGVIPCIRLGERKIVIPRKSIERLLERCGESGPINVV